MCEVREKRRDMIDGSNENREIAVYNSFLLLKPKRRLC